MLDDKGWLQGIYQELRKHNVLMQIQNAIQMYNVTKDPRYLDEARALRGERAKSNANDESSSLGVLK